MTIEQQLQKVIQSALQAQLTAESITATVAAEKIHDGDAGVPEEETYPAIVVVTSTPVPQGHQSNILAVPLFIRAMSYLGEARTKEEHAELCEAVFHTLQNADWSDYEDNSTTVKMGGVMIDAGEEPLIEGGALIIQETRCTVDACYHASATTTTTTTTTTA